MSQTAVSMVEPIQFPRCQITPHPYEQAAFEVEGREVIRYHFGPATPPFCFPLVGPGGRALLRMGNPEDPVGHRHHRGIWVAHNSVNGVDCWNANEGRIVHAGILKYEDGDVARLIAKNHWLDRTGTPMMEDLREIALRPLPGGELLIDFLLTFSPIGGPVTLGKTSFGFLAVRVAKTMSVKFGGGLLRNSEGGVNERGVFWKPARWMDFSGPVTPDVWNGISFFDHPSNPRHPVCWHVRDEGWMGAAFNCMDPWDIKQEGKLVLKYRLYAHDGRREAQQIEAQWRAFAEAGGA
jgi:hypothetical protein